MDTRRCEAAVELARGADLLLCESTNLESHTAEAHERGHLTAAQAAKIAESAGAKMLVLTHFSQRHPRTADFAEEAARHCSVEVRTVADGDVIVIPRRRH